MTMGRRVQEDTSLVRTQIQLTPKQYAFLKARSIDQDISLAQVIRSFVDDQLARHRQSAERVIELFGRFQAKTENLSQQRNPF